MIYLLYAVLKNQLSASHTPRILFPFCLSVPKIPPYQILYFISDQAELAKIPSEMCQPFIFMCGGTVIQGTICSHKLEFVIFIYLHSYFCIGLNDDKLGGDYTNAMQYN